MHFVSYSVETKADQELVWQVFSEWEHWHKYSDWLGKISWVSGKPWEAGSHMEVEMIRPVAGKVYDPCCGSGGMFVQSARFFQERILPGALALFGLILMVALEVKKVRGSILIGVLCVTGAAWALSRLPQFSGLVNPARSCWPTGPRRRPRCPTRPRSAPAPA